MRPRLTSFAVACVSVFAAEPELDPKDLPRFRPHEPNEAAKTFVLREGFRAELAASEPQIGSPVALSFDESGRMYVVEMRDYSERRDEKLGRIRLLEDTDSDGRFEKSAIFAEGLAWPTAVICYEGGVFVGATPNIVFLRDTNGDGKADERRVVFTGFAKGVERLNVQQLLNSFHWGLDNRIHGANGGNGGIIEQVASGAPTLRLGTRDFSFDPRTLTMRAETGGGQHGMSFDDFGRKFVSNNSSHIRMQAYEDRYLQGVSGITLPPGIVDIAREGPAAEVFRISPEEPWRQIRTKWRVAGQVSGPIEGGGRASGYFTGATGGTIYRGDAYPPEFRGNVFVGDAGGNLVHRKLLEPNGALLEAHRPPDESNREFLASRDTWFRPIQFANGPDGCLYVIDMYREVIEHPWSIPPGLKKHIDLDSGRERGRIWRITTGSAKPARSRSILKGTESSALVKMLESENGWHRDTAQRLLFERNATNCIADLKQVARAAGPAPRAHALGLLASFLQLSPDDVAVNLTHGNSAVVERALVAYEGLAESDRLRVDLASCLAAARAHPRVAYQLAWTISATNPQNATELLARIISVNSADSYMRAAVLVAARSRANELFRLVTKASQALNNAGMSEFIARLATLGVDESALNAALSTSADFSTAESFELAGAIVDAMKARKLSAAQLPRLLPKARLAATNSDPAVQIAALRLLKHDDPVAAKSVFGDVFSKAGADAARIEAFRLLSRNLKEAAPFLWDRWPELPTPVRHAALDQFTNRDEGLLLLIEALKAKRISRADLTASQTQILRQGYNPAISRPALELLGAIDSDRAAVIDKYRPTLTIKGNVEAGQRIFTERCATCHRYAGAGVAVGPDLESVRANGREYLLTHIVDPNREVNSRFVGYEAELQNGETATGILARETESEITLRLAGGEERTLPRAQIKRLTASAQSLMPSGLEEGLDAAEFAGLLSYILGIRDAP